MFYLKAFKCAYFLHHSLNSFYNVTLIWCGRNAFPVLLKLNGINYLTSLAQFLPSTLFLGWKQGRKVEETHKFTQLLECNPKITALQATCSCKYAQFYMCFSRIHLWFSMEFVSELKRVMHKLHFSLLFFGIVVRITLFMWSDYSTYGDYTRFFSSIPQ